MQTKKIKINPEHPEPDKIKKAASILKNGGIVAFPTETVYGMGANYNDEPAVRRLYRIKRRLPDKPFTMLISSKDEALRLIGSKDNLLVELINNFWPGPLTIIANTVGGEKIGFRQPLNKIALALVKESGPIAAPSANITGKPPAISAQQIMRDFDGLIDMIIDGGASKSGVPSTIVDFTKDKPAVLREGIGAERIKDFIINHYGRD